uniref:Uncharacterized protein n=1 Tax=Anguilla anguilla TaxID=7936 RepID=A0A0E9VFV8_ANGAN
MTLSTVLLPR